MQTASVTLGDCKEHLKHLESDSLDAMVTDPPAGISFMGKAWDSYESLHHFQEDLTVIFKEALRVLKPGAHGLVWALPRTSMFTGMALIDAGFEVRDSVIHLFGSGMPKGLNVAKAGAGPAWDGWNTTLKPAQEVWWLVRKPIAEPTIVKQVLETGTGAINVDGCRIEMQDRSEYEKKRRSFGNEGRVMHGYKGDLGTRYGAEECIAASVKGRWPSNTVLSHAAECEDGRCVEGCAVAALDEQSGFLHGAGNLSESQISFGDKVYNGREPSLKNPDYHADRGGGASRFFYTAKVPASERKLPDGTVNQHPTAKALKLMRYLVRLVTPPGGTVLDLFAGSGSTGVAAVQEGFSFVGFEMDPEHHRVAALRTEHALSERAAADIVGDMLL